MDNPFQSMKGFAKNPLGILSLLISLLYGIACLVFSLGAKNFTPAERIPLVYFIIIFPFIILFVLFQLVKNHHNKLYAPSDFKNEENFLTAFRQFNKAEEYIKKEITTISKGAPNEKGDIDKAKAELTERQKDLFKTLKTLLFFLHEQKNENIIKLIKDDLSDEMRNMLIFQEMNLVKNNVIKADDRIF